jgi:hypothetical protein
LDINAPLGGDFLLAVPRNNCDQFALSDVALVPLTPLEVPACSFLTTMRGSLGAGFYASGTGPAPFLFARVPPESYALFRSRPAEAPTK